MMTVFKYTIKNNLVTFLNTRNVDFNLILYYLLSGKFISFPNSSFEK